MSVSREALAEALGVQVDVVRCDNCTYHTWEVAGLIECGFWKNTTLRCDRFCSFFEEANTAGLGKE